MCVIRITGEGYELYVIMRRVVGCWKIGVLRGFSRPRCAQRKKALPVLKGGADFRGATVNLLNARRICWEGTHKVSRFWLLTGVDK